MFCGPFGPSQPEINLSLTISVLWGGQGKPARELLAPVYGWFTEGFDTRDLKEAKALDAVAGLVGIEGGVVSGVFNLESSGARASDWRPRHDKRYHEA